MGIFPSDDQGWVNFLQSAYFWLTLCTVVCAAGALASAWGQSIFQERVDRLNQDRIDGLQSDLEAERSRSENIEKKIAPRELTGKGRSDFIATLQSAPDGLKRVVTVTSVFGDSEGQSFARDIADAFIAASWDARTERAGYTSNPSGVSVHVRKGDRPIPEAEAVSDALHRAGVEHQLVWSSEKDPMLIRIMVGLKPDPNTSAASQPRP